MFHFHTDGALAFEQDAVYQCTGEHGQVGAIHYRVQVGFGHAAALTILLVDLIHAHAFLDIIVEVVGGGVAGFHAGFDKGTAHRVGETQVGDVQLAAGAMEGAFTAFIMLRAFENREYVVKAPALVTQGGPMVVVRLVATGIAHGVDGGGAAQGLPAGNIKLAVVEGLLRHGVVTPVPRVGAHHQNDACRYANEQAVIGGAGFEQAYAIIRIFGKAVGEYAAGRTGADNDVIKLHGVCLRLMAQ